MKLLNGVQIGVLIGLVFVAVFGSMTIAENIGEPVIETHRHSRSGLIISREIGTQDISILYIPWFLYVVFTVVVIYWLGEDKWKNRVKSILRAVKK